MRLNNRSLAVAVAVLLSFATARDTLAVADTTVSVTRDGVGVASLRVRAYAPDGTYLRKSRRTDAAGNASFNLRAGTEAKFRVVERGTTYWSEVVTAPAANVNIALVPTTKVLVMKNGVPLVSKLVGAYNASGASLRYRDRTDANGVAEFIIAAGTEVKFRVRDSRTNYWSDLVSAPANTRILIGLGDDRFEENDTQATSADLTAELATSNPVTDLFLAPSDDDWFKVHVAQSSLVTVDLLFAERNDGFDDSDLELELYRADGTRIDYAISPSDNEQLYTLVPGGEDLFVRVYGADNTPWGGAGVSYNDYSLQVTLEPMEDDRFEENDTFATAASLNAELTATNPVTGLFLAPRDDDWFKVTFPSARTTTVISLFNERNDGNDDSDLELELYRADGTRIAEAISGTDNETLTVDLLEAGDLYIRIYGADNTPWGGRGPSFNSYALEVQGFSMDDRFEENDTLAAAADLTAELATSNPVQDLILAAGDDDWFSVQVAQSSLVTVDLFFTERNDGNDDSDLELELYRLDGTLIGSSITGTDNEQVSTWVRGGEALFIRVYGADNTPWGAAGLSFNDYTLGVSSVPMDDDRFEENDTFETAADVTGELAGANPITNLFAAPNDDDWFKVSIPGSTTVTVTVNSLFQERNDGQDNSDLELALYKGDGTFIAQAISPTDNETLTVDIEGPDVLHIRIWGVDNSPWGGRGPSFNTYALEVLGLPLSLDDRFEENDTFETAADLTAELASSNTVAGLYVAAGDDDWFRVQVAASSVVTVDALFTERNDGNDDSDLELGLYRADGTLIGTSVTGTDNEQVSTWVAAGEALFIKVYGADNTPWGAAGLSFNDYDLQVTTVAMEDDRYEENDTFETAADVTGDLGSGNPITNLFAAPNDDDWFKVSIPGASTVTVTVNSLFTERNDGQDNSDLELELFKGDGTFIAKAISGTDNETLTVDIDGPDELHIRIWGVDNSPWGGNGPSFNTYALEVLGIPAAPAPVAALKAAPANSTPEITSVWSGSDEPKVSEAVTVSAAATDADGDTLTYQWSTVAGPAVVTFGTLGASEDNANTATFSAAGTYILRVSVSDGKIEVSEELEVTVTQAASSAKEDF